MKVIRRKKAAPAETEDAVKKHKYNAKKVVIDDITFDSLVEAEYYTDVIKPGIESGEILKVDFHPKYVLLPKNKARFNGKERNFQQMTYSADFRIFYSDNSVKVIDIKGMIPAEFHIKCKLFLYLYDDVDFYIVRSARKSKGKTIEWRTVDI